MKRIKITLSCIIAFLILIFPYNVETLKADAYVKYGRAITDDVGFYKDSSATKLLFYLPYTYYVKILDEGLAVCHVEIYSTNSLTPSIDGYVYTDQLYFDDLNPINPYYEQELITLSVTPFYENSSCEKILRYVFENRSLRLYGYLKDLNGSYLYFAEYNGAIGYVKEEYVTPFSFTFHPNPLPQPEIPDEPTDTTQTENGNGVNALKVGIIISLCLAVVCIIAFTIKPEKRRHVDDADDNEIY